MKIEVIGNLGRDAETKQTQDGREFVAFTVADSYKQNGQEVTNWIECLSNNTKIAQYLTKGTKVFVRGRLTTKIYTKKDGTNAVQLTCNVSELEFCGGGKTDNQAQGSQTEPTGDLPF